jgi:hypothetical protein
MRPVIVLLVAVAALAAGCGSATKAVERNPPPKLPRALASQLAHESDGIAAAVDSGDACRARELGAALRMHATATIGHVPARYRESLSSGVNAVVTGLPACVPVSPAHGGDEDEQGEGPPGQRDKRDKPKDHGKAKGRK